MVAGEYDDGVVQHALALERRQDASKAVVDTKQHLEAAPDVLVRGRGIATHGWEACQSDEGGPACRAAAGRRSPVVASRVST